MSAPVSRPRRLCIVALLLPATLAWADRVVLSPTKDNTLFEDPEGALSSGSGTGLFAGKNGTLIARRALLAFDVAGAVPSGARIDAVALLLHVASAPNDTLRLFTLHRVLADWGEGPSVSRGGRGAPSDTGDATWLHTFFPDQFWTTPGGDFVAAESASRIVGSTGVHCWTSPSMARDVEGWIDSPTQNHGWMLRGPEAAVRSVRRFDSRESDSTEVRPRLVIDYTPEGAEAFRLEPSYPNPFSSETRIDFEIPNAAPARLDVFDARGRHVTTLTSGVVFGIESVVWNGRDKNGVPLGNGVYYLRLTAGGFDEIARKVVLLR